MRTSLPLADSSVGLAASEFDRMSAEARGQHIQQVFLVVVATAVLAKK